MIPVPCCSSIQPITELEARPMASSWLKLQPVQVRSRQQRFRYLEVVERCPSRGKFLMLATLPGAVASDTAQLEMVQMIAIKHSARREVLLECAFFRREIDVFAGCGPQRRCPFPASVRQQTTSDTSRTVSERPITILSHSVTSLRETLLSIPHLFGDCL